MNRNTEIVIRSAVDSDIDPIRFLYLDTIRTINTKDYDQKQIDTWSDGYQDVEKWAEKLKGEHFFVAEKDNTIVGFASLADNQCIDYLFTHKDYQRIGVASKLLERIEDLARNLRMTELWSDVSTTAKQFFSAKGFAVTKVYTKCLKDTEFTNTIMTKKLPVESDQK